MLPGASQVKCSVMDLSPGNSAQVKVSIYKIILLSFLLMNMRAFALNGLYPIGWGPRSKSMGGVGVAYPQETFSGLYNPATIIWVGARFDGALEYYDYHSDLFVKNNEGAPPFNEAPARSSSNGHYDLSTGKAIYYIAIEAGFNYVFSDDTMSIGLLLSPQSGGYVRHRPYLPITSFSKGFVTHILYPTLTGIYSAKITDAHSLGIGVDFTVAFLNIKHADNMNLYGSAYPGFVTDKGYDHAFGYALRFGWMWQATCKFAIGIGFRTKTFMTHFKKYKGALSIRGKADLPSILNGGISYQFTPQFAMAFDMGRIYNADVPALSLPSHHGTNFAGLPGGSGLSWRSRNFYKLGASLELTDNLFFRIGYNYSLSPIPHSTSMDPNYLGEEFAPRYNVGTPITTNNYITTGIGYTFCNNTEINFSYIHGFRNGLTGRIPSTEVAQGGGECTLSSHYNTYQI